MTLPGNEQKTDSPSNYGSVRLYGERVLLSPWFLIALGVLILNDHFLKALYPSWLTGKLSDFSGLFVFVVFFTVALSRWLRTPTRIFILHAAIGLTFVIWKLAPVEIVIDWAARLTSWPMPSRVKDATDLMALSILPVSYWFLSWGWRIGHERSPDSILARLATCFVMIAAGGAIMATSVSTPEVFDCCEGIRGNVDGDENDEIDIADLVYLVDYLHNNGPRPECIFEADVNASGDKNPIDDDDVEYLWLYMTMRGPPPPECW